MKGYPKEAAIRLVIGFIAICLLTIGATYHPYIFSTLGGVLVGGLATVQFYSQL